MTTLADAATKIQDFQAGSLKVRLSNLESRLIGTGNKTCDLLCNENSIDRTLIDAAVTIKHAVGQIDAVIHGIGIMLLLPRILEPGEIIHYASLGAGNTGKSFDLEPDRRVAEFKFAQWRGGSETTRQNEFFKDFFNLAECNKNKTRYLYVLDTTHPMKFLNGGRSILAGNSGVVSKNQSLRDAFVDKYGANRFIKVREYYEHQKNSVELIDITSIVPDLALVFQRLT